ncbi:hypothetical protein [Nostoc sp.]|uniref:hypothetical protein n=1 Tax=Nostoc sp. TaxID=1180 RepID=UPI002FF4453E
MRTTRSALQPDINTAVAGGVVLVTNKLQPQIQNSFDKAREALEKAFSAKNTAESAVSDAANAAREAGAARAEAVTASRKAVSAQSTADEASSIAGTAKGKANTAFDKAGYAEQKAELSAKQAEAARIKANSAEDIAKIASRESELAKGLASQADGKAASATSKAVQASSEALKASNEVSGLKGIVDGVKGKLGDLGRTISKIESAVGDAVVKAAEAIGISRQALSATARLAGRILEIFQVIGTIFTLIEQLATLEVLGGRIDAVEAGLVALGNSVSGILGKLLGLQNRIGRNEGAIADVKNIAIDAKGIGEAANLKAGQAIESVTGVRVIAVRADGKASQAQTTADGAVRNASRANENATTAYQKATEAQGIGEQAKRVAQDALGKAGVALTTALTAIALYQGVKSLRGLQGIPGIPGRQGERGLQGIQGVPGTPGRDGVTTVVTLPGTPGARGQTGRQGVPGIPGRNGRDVNPAEAASLRALIISQHTQTRANSTVQHTATRTTILTPIMAALAPIFAICQQILNVVSAAASAAQLALLNIINSKLGNQLPGGLSGTFTRLWQTLQIDRILNILILITTFHNAAMLSNNIVQTLFSGIDNLGQAVGFKWKNEKGEESGFGGIISQWTGNFFKSIFGETTLQNINTTWNAANRTYQSVTNALWNIQGMFDSMRSITELIVNNTGKIGNALKRGGAIFEDAFSDMSERTTARTAQQAKWDAVLENAQPIENAVSAFSQVTGDIVSIGDNFNQLKDQKKEFEDSKKTGEDAIKALVTGEKNAAKVNQPIESTDVQKNDD